MFEWKNLAKVGLTCLTVVLLAIYWEYVLDALLYVFNGLWPILLSLVIAYIADIPLEFLDRGYKRIFHGELAGALRRPICMAAAVLIIVGLLVFILMVVLPEFVKAVFALQANLPAMARDAEDWLNSFAFGQRIVGMLPNGLEGVAQVIEDLDFAAIASNIFAGGATPNMNNIMATATSVAGVVGSTFVAIMLAFIWLAEKERLINQISRATAVFSGTRRLREYSHAMHILNRAFQQYIVGQFVGALFQGALCTIFMVALGLPYAASVGVLVGITALVPVIGPIVGLILGTLLVLSVSVWKALFFLIYIILVQQLWAAVMYPRFVGYSIGLPGMWIMVAITVGGIFGLLGMTVAVPLAGTCYQLLREYVSKQEEKKALEKAEKEKAALQAAEAAEA